MNEFSTAYPFTALLVAMSIMNGITIYKVRTQSTWLKKSKVPLALSINLFMIYLFRIVGYPKAAVSRSSVK